MNQASVSSLEFVFSFINAALATTISQDLLIKCPAQALPPAAGPFFGALLELQASAVPSTATTPAYGQVTLFETPTTSADGTPVVTQCTNRGVFGAVPSSLVTVFSGPTSSAPGTQLESGFMTDKDFWKSKCWLLKPGLNYFLRFTNAATGTAIQVSITGKLSMIPVKDSLYTRCYE